MSVLEFRVLVISKVLLTLVISNQRHHDFGSHLEGIMQITLERRNYRCNPRFCQIKKRNHRLIFAHPDLSNLSPLLYPMTKAYMFRECVRSLDLRVQVHPGELWVSKQRVHIVL